MKKSDTWSPSPVPSEKGTGAFVPVVPHTSVFVRPDDYGGHLVFETRRLQQEATIEELRQAQLVAIAAACVHDCDQFDNLVFTGSEDPKRGKQPSSAAERSASNIFAARRRTLASKQARDGGWSESELGRALLTVRDNERRLAPTPMNQSCLVFKDPL